ncbi:MAG: sugar ABC transporter substrate-binding protein [Planctomycetes bacterium]|nr:sugar ABC transporter substrate-binding protein [Planctomycetota bacterium]
MAALGAILLLAPASCARRPAEETGLAVLFSFQDLETEFWVAAHRVITTALKEKGIQVIEQNAHQDANRQLEQVRAAISQDVDGIIIIPQDGESALTIIGEANEAGIPIAVFNRPPADRSRPAVVVVADNARIAEQAVEHLADEAARLGRKARPLILVGDLGDPNSIDRRKGFYRVVDRRRDMFHDPVEVPTKWDANTALSNLEAALQADPDVDLIFTSSDFMYPQIRAVLEPLGRWKKKGEPGHVILGGLDGDLGACRLMKEGYVDATGVQDLFFEAESVLSGLLEAIEKGEKTPERWTEDPGFALTQANIAQRELDMWGCRLASQAGR